MRARTSASAGWLWWKRIALPAVFPFYVTGAITASGGSWNASIVVGGRRAGATRQLDGARSRRLYRRSDRLPAISSGRCSASVVMSLFVVTLNRVFWRPLYCARRAQVPYQLRTDQEHPVNANRSRTESRAAARCAGRLQILPQARRRRARRAREREPHAAARGDRRSSRPLGLGKVDAAAGDRRTR